MYAQFVFVSLMGMIFGICSSTSADFFVATNGNDTNPGTKEKPFATLERARDAVREQPKEKNPLTVWIAGGTYYRNKTFSISAADLGTKDSPIIYRAVVGEEVRLVGGKRLPVEAFKPVAAKEVQTLGMDVLTSKKVLQADLKALGITQFGEISANGRWPNLCWNDKPLPLAHWPNAGFAKIGEVVGGKHGGRFLFDSDRLARWTSEPELWLHGYWFWNWSDQFQKVQSLDPASRTISLAPPLHGYGYKKGQYYYALNAISELDMPGEWYLHRQSGVLYLWPPEKIDKVNIVFSLLESPMIVLNQTSHITIRNVTIEATRGNGVEIEGGESNLIAGCTIRNIGALAVDVCSGRQNGVMSCDLYNIGRGAIVLGGGERSTLTSAGNYAKNNHIHHYAQLKRTYEPAVRLQGVGNIVSNNLIHDAPHMAIGFHGNEHVMELNEIHGVCQETSDAGAFYTGRDWTVRGNIIRHNYIHHVASAGEHGAQGIYLDDCASGSVVVGNVIYKTTRGMLFGGGRDNVIEGNLIVSCNNSISFDNRGIDWMKDKVAGVMTQRLKAIPYQQPPWSQRYPQLVNLLNDAPGVPKNNTVRNNIICGSPSPATAKEVVHFGIVVGNRNLGNAGNDAAAIRTASKALSIPIAQIGIRKDEYRTKVPLRNSRNGP